MSAIKWVKRYPIDTLQIYFASSLELQNELIRNGFQVPMSKDRKIRTPLPIVYVNNRGWKQGFIPEPLTFERLILPEWLGRTPEELGWKKAEGKEGYYLPSEKAFVNIGFDDKGLIYFKLEVDDYHLERTSIRGVNPEKWNNWAMFYINAKYLDEFMKLLEDNADCFLVDKLYPVLEKQQGGKETTYYGSLVKKKSLGVPVEYYSLCLGCFDLALEYFKRKAVETGLGPGIVDKLRLRLTYSREIKAGLKIGLAKIEGKEPQIMFKLATDHPIIKIKGILKDEIEGKARGKLEYCDHLSKNQLIVTKAKYVCSALQAVLPKKSRLF